MAATPEFTDVHRASSGCTDPFREAFGDEAGLGGRATIGAVSLAHNHCFENWLTVKIRRESETCAGVAARRKTRRPR